MQQSRQQSRQQPRQQPVQQPGQRSTMDREEYVEAVLSLVERVPRGRVTTYGLIAEAVGRGGPRQVGQVMAQYGGPVPWWRVVRADGSLPASHGDRARQAYLAEGTPLRPSGAVDLRSAVWWPPEEPPDATDLHSRDREPVD